MRRPDWITATRARTVVLALIAVWAAWLTWSLGDSTTTAEQATERAATAENRLDRLADEIAHACEQGGEAAAKLGAACISADQAKQQPPTAPRDGADGRGITSTGIRAGRLVVAYSDGTTTDVGPVAGAPGPQGRGIVATAVDGDDLVVVFSDGARESLGRIVGRDGTDGADGADGRGIASVTTDGGRLLITYTDGTSEDAGPLPAGPQGEQGPRGERGPQGEPGPACPDGYSLREVLLVAADGGAYDGVACVEATDTNSNDSTPNTPR